MHSQELRAGPAPADTHPPGDLPPLLRRSRREPVPAQTGPGPNPPKPQLVREPALLSSSEPTCRGRATERVLTRDPRTACGQGLLNRGSQSTNGRFTQLLRKRYKGIVIVTRPHARRGHYGIMSTRAYGDPSPCSPAYQTETPPRATDSEGSAELIRWTELVQRPNWILVHCSVGIYLSWGLVFWLKNECQVKL